jgi:small subunit ribosomal protein S8
MGTAIVSTPKGVMTGFEAQKNNVGGEVVCYVW